MHMIDAASADTLARLHALQYGDDQPMLLFTQAPFGLGGQIHRRIVGLRLALLFNRKVVFPSLAEPPYGQVFEPIHSEVDYDAALSEAVDVFAPGAQAAKIVKLDFADMMNDAALKDRVYLETPAAFSQTDNPKLFYDGLLLSFCQLTAENQKYVDEAAKRLNIDERAVGVHIRRGDKSVETPFIPLSVIAGHIRQICERSGLQRVLLCSDDDSVFDQLELPAGVTLIVDTLEKRYNNANHRLLLRNPDLSEQETKTAIKNIYLLGRCSYVIGQTNAQFSWLSSAQICFRNRGRSSGVLISGEYSLAENRWLGFYYAAKRRLRAAARRLLPRLRANSIAKK